MSGADQLASTTSHEGFPDETASVAQEDAIGDGGEKISMSAIARTRFLDVSFTATYCAVRAGESSFLMLEISRPEA
jgi:hypothetical protein